MTKQVNALTARIDAYEAAEHAFAEKGGYDFDYKTATRAAAARHTREEEALTALFDALEKEVEYDYEAQRFVRPETNQVRSSRGRKAQAPLPTAAPSVPLAKDAVIEYPEMTQARLEYANGYVKSGMACERFVDAMEAAFGADWYAVARLSAAERKALSGNEKARAEGVVHARKMLRAAVLAAGHAEKGADMPWSRARNLAKARAGEVKAPAKRGARTTTGKAKPASKAKPLTLKAQVSAAFLQAYVLASKDGAAENVVNATEYLREACALLGLDVAKLEDKADDAANK